MIEQIKDETSQKRSSNQQLLLYLRIGVILAVAGFLGSLMWKLFFALQAGRMSEGALVTTKTVGELGTKDYRMFFYRGQQLISPWHDIPMIPPGLDLIPQSKLGYVVNMVNEIPKDTVEKMEVNKEEAHNPIAQDLDKKGQPRVLKYSSLPWNYGMIPQTWEDPEARFHDSAQSPPAVFQGDGDPVDVVELGSRPLARGEVLPVRILGAFALIDEGELDWKLLALSLDDELAKTVFSLKDLLAQRPDQIEHVHEWYENYKTAEGKPKNHFAFHGQPQDQYHARRVIEETHRFWERLSAKTSSSSSSSSS
jgi:inorganic pyrophosphatase